MSVKVMFVVLYPTVLRFARLLPTTLSPGQKRWLHIEPKISLVAALAGSSLGVYSHVFLDSIMHSDLRPFATFTDANSMLNAITVAELHLLCVATGVFGVMVLLVVFLWKKWTYEV